MSTLSAEEIAEFREIFNLVDKDRRGHITRAELTELMDTLGDLKVLLINYCFNCLFIIIQVLTVMKKIWMIL